MSSLATSLPPHLRSISKETWLRIFKWHVLERIRASLDLCDSLDEGLLTRDLTEDENFTMIWSPTALLGICSAFRRLLQRNPRTLWKYLVVPFIGTSTLAHADAILAKVKRHKQASGSSRLHIHVYASDLGKGDVSELIKARRIHTCLVVLSQAWRWQNLSVHQHAERRGISIPLASHSPLTSLKRATISNIAYKNMKQTTLFGWSACTRLYLIVYAARDISPPLHEMRNLSQLTLDLRDHPTFSLSKRVTTDTLAQALRMMDRCRRLFEAIIQIPGEGEDEWDHVFHPTIPGPVLKSESLRLLRLSGYRKSGPSFAQILLACFFPGLVMLSIRSEPCPDHVVEAIRAWSCSLTHLELVMRPSVLYHLPARLVDAVPDLKVLSVIALGTHRSSAVIMQLCDKNVFPKLYSLAVDVTSLSVPSPLISRGFDFASAYRDLIHFRPGIVRIVGSATCHPERLAEFRSFLQTAGQLRYHIDVFAQTEDRRLATLRSNEDRILHYFKYRAP